jgi:hypothetical protein
MREDEAIEKFLAKRLFWQNFRKQKLTAGKNGKRAKTMLLTIGQTLKGGSK